MNIIPNPTLYQIMVEQIMVEQIIFSQTMSAILGRKHYRAGLYNSKVLLVPLRFQI